MLSTNSRKILRNGSIISAVLLLFTGLSFAQPALQTAASKEFKRLVNLRTALGRIPFDRQDKEPHKSFLKRNDKDIVYSEPAGEWYVRSERFWDLYKKYKTLPIADRIAWTAAENPLPGECEGYINCYLYNIRVAEGEYLMLYPKGAYAKKAVQKTVEFLKFMADDAVSPKKNYDGPADASDRAEFTKMIKELREILSIVSQPGVAKALTQLKQIEEGYK